MKTIPTPHRAALAAIALAVVLSAPSAAQAADRLDKPDTWTDSANRAHKADQIIGQNVRSTTGQDLGEVRDLVVDADGRIVYALISSGGILGVGDVMRAVPYGAFTSLETGPGKALAVDLHGSDWNKAPIARLDHIDALTADREGANIYRYYGQDWPKRSRRDDDGRGLLLVSKVDGQEIMHEGQHVGEIEDVLVQRGHVIAVVDPAAGYGVAGQKYALGFNQLSWSGPAATTANTTLAASDFAEAKPLAWDSRDLKWDKPYVLNDPTMGGTRLAPITEGSAPAVPVAGRSAVADVRRSLLNDPALASAMKDVQVMSRGDELVITGQVGSRDLKERIEDRVERVAKGWDVKNELSVVRSAAE